MGASSGVGSAAIQIAKGLGARVITTGSSEAKRDLGKSLGADFAVDATNPAWPAEVRRITEKRGVDLVVEHVGGDVLPKVFECLARGGTVVTCGATAGRGPSGSGGAASGSCSCASGGCAGRASSGSRCNACHPAACTRGAARASSSARGSRAPGGSGRATAGSCAPAAGSGSACSSSAAARGSRPAAGRTTAGVREAGSAALSEVALAR